MARWEPSERDDITKRFLRGETATEIARAYKATHPAVTRNAVLGVLHRAKVLGQGRASIQSQPTALQRSRVSRPVPLRTAAEPAKPDAAIAYVAPVVVESVSLNSFARSAGDRKAGSPIPIREPGPKARPLLQLGPGSCRFPVGEPERGAPRLFCGERAEPGRPYCASCRKHTIDRNAKVEPVSELARFARRFG